MNWLLLNHNLRGHGTWHRAWHIARELVRRGDAVTLWTAAPHHFYRTARDTAEGVAILETPSWPLLAGPDEGWGVLDLPYRMAQALHVRCDAVYAFAHPPTIAAPAWWLRRRRRLPLLYDWCDWYAGGIFPKRAELRKAGIITGEKPWQGWLERREVSLERAMLGLADGVTVISHRLHELAREAGVPAERLHLLPNGADLEGIHPLEALHSRDMLNLSREHLYLGYVANYHPDQDFFLRALAIAARRLPALRLIHTGPSFDAALIRELDLAPHIIELGRVAHEHLPLVLGASDAVALPMEDNPSNRARLPYKFTDYLAAGRPIVTCAVGDLAEYFAADQPAIGMASPPTVEDYAGALIEVLGPASDRAALGKAARTLAEERFAWPQLVEGLLQFAHRTLP